jgi:hypothetical protein
MVIGPKINLAKTLKVKEPGKSQEKITGSFMITGSPLMVLKYSKLVCSLFVIFLYLWGTNGGKKIPLQNKENFVCYFLEYLEPASSLILIFFKYPEPAGSLILNF